MLAKTGYHIHTNSIKENIVPKLNKNNIFMQKKQIVKCTIIWYDH